MTPRRKLIAGLLAVLLGAATPPALAARPDTVELRGKTGTLGRLPRVVVDDGGSYVAADKLAALLKGTWKAAGARATLAVAGRAAAFERNQPRAVIHGQAVALDAGPRTGAGGWLLPEDFLVKGLPKLAPGVWLAAGEARKPPAKAVKDTAMLGELRTRSYPSFTRIVIETDGAIVHSVLPGRPELRVRLSRLALPGPRSEEVADGLVKEIHLEPAGGDALLRIVLQGAAGEVKASALQDPYRLVLDVHRPRESAGAATGHGGLEPLRLIAIDAGHGGHDPGATGPTGVMEKEVVLDVARRVARMVQEDLGVKVALIRSGDVFVPLRERTNTANKQRADLFVSIHANAHPRSVSEGVETYFLSSEASDTDARQTAAVENGVVRLESPASRAKGDLLKSILWDLAQSEFQRESSFMAETVLDSMSRSLNLVNRGVKQAGFYVLGGAAMPAILIEIGFMTNPREERKLATPAYRESVARAIYSGLAEYKRRYDQRLSTAALPVKSAR